MSAPASPEAAFASLAARFAREPDVTEGTGFGKGPGLRVGGKIFAMLVRGELVVKLPRERCSALVEDGAGEFLSMGERRMKEWVAVDLQRADEWPPLAREALDFVRPGA